MEETNTNKKAPEAAPEEPVKAEAAEEVSGQKEKKIPPKKPEKREERAKELEGELTAAKKELAEAQQTLAETRDALLRTAAEFDNYKKRTAREKDALYGEAVADTVAKLLPVLDSLERAASAEGDAEVIKKGVEMTLKQFGKAFEALGVEEIKAEIGSPIDPEAHNAMMRVEDPELPESSIAEVLAKGYKIGGRVIRHTMIKSAN